MVTTEETLHKSGSLMIYFITPKNGLASKLFSVINIDVLSPCLSHHPHDSTNIFCDKYDAVQKTYCKRLRVLCPYHTKEPKVRTALVQPHVAGRKNAMREGKSCVFSILAVFYCL